MRPTFKRLEVRDLGNLEKLVAENIEGIEPGLRVIDSRLVLGQAAIDLVALDAKESLVLVALDFLADEGLLLRAMDAYSWCLEYPDALRRLYPTANLLPTRPPRILFIVERLTDAFVRRIKHLSFLEIDCLEFRHLEVNGASAVYFDLVERLRRGAAVEPPADTRMITAPPTRTPKRSEAEPPVAPASRAIAEPKVAQPSRPPAVRETASAIPERTVSLETRLAELLAEASAPMTASSGEMMSAGKVSFAVEMPSLETLFAPGASAAGETPSADEMPLAAEMPAEEYATEEAPAGASADVDAEEVAEESALRFESVDETAQQEELDVPSVAARVAANPDWQTLLSELGVEIPGPAKGTKAESPERFDETGTAEPSAVAPVHTSEAAVEEAAPVVGEGVAAVERAAPAEDGVPAVEEAAPTVVEPTAPSPTLPAWAKPSANRVAQPIGGRTYFFSQAAKGTTAADAQAPSAAVAPVTTAPAPAQPTTASPYLRPAAPAQPAVWAPAPSAAQTAVPVSQPAAAAAPKPTELVADRPELEALHFPKDGLSRQWLEFLNQLGGTK